MNILNALLFSAIVASLSRIDHIGHPHKYLMVFPTVAKDGVQRRASGLLKLLNFQPVANVRLLPSGPVAKTVQQLVRAQTAICFGRLTTVNDFELIVCNVWVMDVSLDNVSTLDKGHGHPRNTSVHKLIINQIDRQRNVLKGVQKCQELPGDLVFFLR
ncbi:MAG: hypothetical protein [Caudoviricetes sp.]|nr:MAG: hypothetical protein [Caudoviricetes sp.]